MICSSYHLKNLQVILNNCIKEITNQLRVASPAGSPHVLMMRSLLETAMSLQVNTNYSNVIALLQKVKVKLPKFHIVA